MLERELTPSEISRVNKLVRKECCNHENGNCILLDNGDEHTCPQLISRHLLCRWFEKAVLPLDQKLLVDLSEGVEPNRDTCQMCGVVIYKTSNRQKYCERCAAKNKRKKIAEYMQKKRGDM